MKNSVKAKPIIFIVDDEKILALLVARRMQTLGYQVHCFHRGKEALQALREITPTLILLDIWLPDISGFDVFKQLKKEPHTKKVPVVFFSADPSKEEFCLQQLGGDAFVQKPYDSHELLEVIQKIVKEKLHKK